MTSNTRPLLVVGIVLFRTGNQLDAVEPEFGVKVNELPLTLPEPKVILPFFHRFVVEKFVIVPILLLVKICSTT